MAMTSRQVEDMVRSLRAVKTDTQAIEVKESVLRLPTSMAETVSAFSNGSGGIIILGLSEKNGFTVAPGFRGKPMADALATLCSDKLTPPIRPEIDIVGFENTQVVVANVSELPPRDKPCYVTDRGVYQGSFIRVSDGDRRLTAYEIDRLLEDRTQPTFDDEVIEQTSRADLNATLVDAVLARHRAIHPRIFADMPDDEALVKLHVLGRAEDGSYRPTLAGLLALGTYPQQYYPRLTVTFTAYPSEQAESGLIRYADTETMAGPITDIVSDTVAAVSRNAVENSACIYPPAAVREAVTNALAHRDYSPLARSTAVQVNLYEDRLEVITPGGLYGTVTVDTIDETGYCSARNQFLTSLLETLPLAQGYAMENRGGGYDLILDELERANIEKPQVDDRVSSFVLTMVRKRTDAEPFDSDDEVLSFLAQTDDASAAEIAEALALSKRTITHRLSKLVEAGQVVRIGKPRSPKQRYCLA